MAVIQQSEAKNLFLKALVSVYRERPEVKSFFRSFFTEKETLTKYVSIEVERGTERVAVDVIRGTQGNRNTFNKSTEKIILPPYYREFFDISELQAYDTVFGSEMVSHVAFATLVDAVRDKMNMLIDKIERAYELQCAQVLHTGIVTLVNGDNIDFKRKAASKVDYTTGTPAPWTTGTVDPLTHLEAGAKFLREVGKSQGGNMNLILGGRAFNALISNTTFASKADIKSFDLMSIREPQRNSVGASYHGRLSVGSYTMDMWTYPEVYENAAGVSTPYMDEDKIIIVPEVTKFTLSYAGVPVLGPNNIPVPSKGKYHFGEYTDKRNHNVDYDVRSAGVAIPTAVDQIYTAKVVS